MTRKAANARTAADLLWTLNHSDGWFRPAGTGGCTAPARRAAVRPSGDAAPRRRYPGQDTLGDRWRPAPFASVPASIFAFLWLRSGSWQQGRCDGGSERQVVSNFPQVPTRVWPLAGRRPRGHARQESTQSLDRLLPYQSIRAAKRLLRKVTQLASVRAARPPMSCSGCEYLSAL